MAGQDGGAVPAVLPGMVPPILPREVPSVKIEMPMFVPPNNLLGDGTWAPRDWMEHFKSFINAAGGGLKPNVAYELLKNNITPSRVPTLSRAGRQYAAESSNAVPVAGATDAEWKAYLDWLLENLAVYFQEAQQTQRRELDKKWRDIKMKDGEDVPTFVDRIQRLVDEFEKLVQPSVKTLVEVRNQFFNALPDALQIAIMSQFQQTEINTSDTLREQQTKWEQLIAAATSMAALLPAKISGSVGATNNDGEDQDESKKGRRKRGNDKDRPRQPIKEQICWKFLQGDCKLGQDCPRLHMKADDYKQTEFYNGCGNWTRKKVDTWSAATAAVQKQTGNTPPVCPPATTPSPAPAAPTPQTPASTGAVDPVMLQAAVTAALMVMQQNSRHPGQANKTLDLDNPTTGAITGSSESKSNGAESKSNADAPARNSEIWQNWTHYLTDNSATSGAASGGEVRTEVARATEKRLRLAQDFIREFRENRAKAMIAQRSKSQRPIGFGVGDYVICHHPSAPKGVSAKLVHQFIGPFKVVAKHHTPSGVLAPNTFDLEHVHTGKQLSALNVERLHRYRPGSDFLLLDYDKAVTPPTPDGQPPAPEIIIDDLLLHDVVAVKNPSDESRFAFGKVMEIDYFSGKISIHYWGTPNKDLSNASLTPEYFDPQDGRSLFATRVYPRNIPTLSLIEVKDILARPFALTKKRTVPKVILASLSSLGKVACVLAN